jgi:CheY-like chemotaxis protein
MLVVADTGIGIAPAVLPQVFDLFFQSGQESHRSTGGLGIGLTLVKRLVEMHQGKVSVESGGLGKGTRVIVRFPAIPLLPQRAAAPPSPRPAWAARTIVIVEDEPDARETLQLLLETMGHRVVTAGDGASGVEKIRQTRPDVAIVDISLPGVSGYELVRRLRADDVRTYLIALSGYGGEEDKQRALSAGFDAHLAKPADMEELYRLIAEGAAN